jgi:UDP-N-acetylglucosamine--N-acetylmuramyl-(pentapeptide) pyrophosphoryl-undecaprenol N-acetylglucosamine transferase
MVKAFAAADLVICRAGATTTAELIAAGKASIMVPFPFAADDHQRKNAEALEQAGAAKMILQQALNGKGLADEIKSLVAEPETLSKMETAGRRLSRGDAAAAVVDMIEVLATRSTREA